MRLQQRKSCRWTTIVMNLARSIHILSKLHKLNPSNISASSSTIGIFASQHQTYVQELKRRRPACIYTFLLKHPTFHIPHSTSSFIPMRITGLPHLTRETRRRHDRFFFILSLHKARRRHVPRRALLLWWRQWNAAAFNLQLARLALFLRRQRFAGPDRGAARFVAVVDVSL